MCSHSAVSNSSNLWVAQSAGNPKPERPPRSGQQKNNVSFHMVSFPLLPFYRSTYLVFTATHLQNTDWAKCELMHKCLLENPHLWTPPGLPPSTQSPVRTLHGPRLTDTVRCSAKQEKRGRNTPWVPRHECLCLYRDGTRMGTNHRLSAPDKQLWDAEQTPGRGSYLCW